MAAVVGQHDNLPDGVAAPSNSAKRRKKIMQHGVADLQDVQKTCAPPFQAAKGLLVAAPAKATAPAEPRARKANKQPVSPVCSVKI